MVIFLDKKNNVAIFVGIHIWNIFMVNIERITVENQEIKKIKI